ncbi:MAG TPA: aldolase, partial [Nocardioides sp.]|nr:aldolase [Nocardioides sp.]
MESLDHLVGGLTSELDTRLADVDTLLAARYPGERAGRQPVHTVYVPADRFHRDLVADHAAAALAVVDAHGDRLLELVDDDHDLVDRVRAKLEREAVEDLRIDFEDGYGTRSDEDEDGDVRRAATDLRAALDAGTAAPFTGIRFKGFEAPTRSRGVRTLALFLATLVEDGPLPATFVVTLPKVTAVEQVEALVHVAARLESALRLDDGILRFEIQVETPQSILGPDGSALVARMVHASGGRCTGLHYGTYDYSAF